MPNHITNILKVEGDEQRVKELFTLVHTDKSMFDFDKIIPMPESLQITSGSKLDNAIAILTNDTQKFDEMLEWNWVKEANINSVEKLKEKLIKNLSPEDMRDGKIALDNLQKYGHKDWYSWSIANWGTKWNAYEIHNLDNCCIKFDTAWSTPFPIFEQLSKMFPDLTLTVSFADEDIGSNCGAYTLQYGKVISEFMPTGWNATKFAYNVKGYEGDDFLEIIAYNLTTCDENHIEYSLREDIVKVLKSSDEKFSKFSDFLKRNSNDDSLSNVKNILKSICIEEEVYETIKKVEEI